MPATARTSPACFGARGGGAPRVRAGAARARDRGALGRGAFTAARRTSSRFPPAATSRAGSTPSTSAATASRSRGAGRGGDARGADLGPDGCPRCGRRRAAERGRRTVTVRHAGRDLRPPWVWDTAQLGRGARVAGPAFSWRTARRCGWRPGGRARATSGALVLVPRRLRAAAATGGGRDDPRFDGVRLALFQGCSPRAPRRWGPRSCAPRTRPTSRSASTTRARCSTAAAGWSRRPRTFRCTSAACRARSRRCSSAPRYGPATW